MAEQTVDKAIEVCNLKPASGCRTKGLLLDGAHGWSPTMFIRLVQDFGLENEVSWSCYDVVSLSKCTVEI